jgi:hypothetical protein
VFSHSIGVRGGTDITLYVEDDVSHNTIYVFYGATVHGSEEKDVGSGTVIKR